jgi:serine/threonine protein kinase
MPSDFSLDHADRELHGGWIGDRFRVEKRVAIGGMGTVYRAIDQRDGGTVAVKILRGDQHVTHRFVQEARMLASLAHPGIVAYVDHGLTPEGAPFLAMEWLDGEDLHTRLRRGPVSGEQAFSMAAQIVESLIFAHERGIIHRDLKPSNIFLVERDVQRTKLLDFGVASWTAATHRYTQEGAIIGTPSYMAPEQARGDRQIGPTADLFSLGCILYECLTGASPFEAHSAVVSLSKLLFSSVPSIELRRPDLAGPVAHLIHSMLAHDRDARPVMNRALALRLRDLAPLAGADRLAPRASATSSPHLIDDTLPSIGGSHNANTGPIGPSEPTPSFRLSSERQLPSEQLPPFTTRIIDVLARYTPLAWPIFESQCKQRHKDPRALQAVDLDTLAEPLADAAVRFGSPHRRAALLAELRELSGIAETS